MIHQAAFTTNILLVDDRPQNLMALRVILEPLGERLVLAQSGEEALKYLLEDEFAVILLDVVMPGLDGFQTAAAIKERERTRHTPIIFLTAASQHEQQVFRGYDIGGVDYITKPFNPDILRLKVGVFVDLYRKNALLRHQDEQLRENERRERIRAIAEQQRLGEQRYQTLAESMPQIVWTANAAGDVTYTNQRCIDFIGLASDVLRERGWQTALHPQDADDFVQGWNRAVHAKQDYEAFLRLRSARDGAYHWHLWRAVPVRGSGGEIVSWIGTSTDIDDHERATTALKSLAEASTILSSSLDFLSSVKKLPSVLIPTIADWCTIDLLRADGSIETVASAHADPEDHEMLAQFTERHPPKLTHSLGPGHAMASGKSELISLVDNGSLAVLALEDPYFQGLRDLKVLSCVSAPILARGKIMGAISFGATHSRRPFDTEDLLLVEDLARRIANAIDNAELYEVAERERVALQQANLAKDEFLAVMSHELRSPLNAILGWVQLMQTGRLSAAECERGLQTIERNARAQSQLIGDLLDVSRIIAGKLQLDIQAIDLRAIVEATVDSIRPAARNKGVEILSALDASIPTFHGDPVRLQQIVSNLLSNAIKFTPGGGRVEVRLFSHDDAVTFEVVDSGAGIRAEFLPFVFERFRQADSSMARAHGGLGLGLSIVRHLTELHGGIVRAASEGEGRGAQFTVVLPFSRSTRPPTRMFQPHLPTKLSSSNTPLELEGLRVLLVEDLPDGRELFTFMVERAGANVVAVGTAEAAYEAILAEPPDILVSDIGLPGADGFSLMERVRALAPERGGNTPAIAMTAHASPSDQQRALAVGFHGYLAKPVERNQLIALIRAVATSATRPSKV